MPINRRKAKDWRLVIAFEPGSERKGVRELEMEKFLGNEICYR